ncbi:MAG: hypothetical protein AB7K24_13780 [Gemmataceae bacterium]
MFRTRILLGIVAIALVLAGGLSGQEKKFKGRIPPGWAKLGLIDKQKDAIYGVQEKYYKQIADLEKQIATLKKAEYDDMVQVLNADQKKRLKEIEGDKKGTGTKSPETKKADE